MAGLVLAKGDSMPATWVSEFIAGLHALEDQNEIEPLLACFSEEASVWNIAHNQPRRGKGQIREFWELYRRQFGRVHSRFERVIEAEDQAALEWQAEGTLPAGSTISYRGVTLLRQADGGIAELASYFDPRPFEQYLHRRWTASDRAAAGRAPAAGPAPGDAETEEEEATTSTLSYG